MLPDENASFPRQTDPGCHHLRYFDKGGSWRKFYYFSSLIVLGLRSSGSPFASTIKLLLDSFNACILLRYSNINQIVSRVNTFYLGYIEN